MKARVVEILRNKLKQGTNKQVIWEADIDDIAEKVVKLFCQPDVIKAVCGNLHHFTDIAHLGRCEECLETKKT